MFPKSPIPDDVAFVRALQEELVLAVPGVASADGTFPHLLLLDDRTLSRSWRTAQPPRNSVKIKIKS